MSVRNLLTVNTIYIALVALVSLIAPATILEASGMAVNEVTIALNRTIGAVIIGYAVTSWLLRDAESSPALRAFMLGGGVAYLVTGVVFIIHVLSGVGNASGWAFAVIDLLLAAAFVNSGRA